MRRRVMSTILVLTPYVPHPPSHGGSIRSRVLLETLAKDHTVHLAAAIATDADRANAAALAKELGLHVHELPAHAAPRASLLQKLRHWTFGGSELLHRRWKRGAIRVVNRLLRDHTFDLVVLDSTFVLPVWDHGGNILLHLHNLEHATFARDDRVQRSLTDRWTRRIEARNIRSYEKMALWFSQLTVTVSEDDRRLALAFEPTARVAVVPNSIDLDRLPLLGPAPPGPPRLLYVGGLDYPPNLEAVTELVEQHLPALRAAFPGLVVRLVGRDDAGHGARFREVEGVEVVGPVADLLPQYRDSHAVYLPLRSGGGTRIKILEAWALGRPVLATAVAAEGLEVADGVQLRQFETVDQGIGALRDVLAGQGTELVAAGRAFVEQHHSHRVAIARLRELVAALLARA